MRWKGRQGSSNLEDRRGQSGGGGGGFRPNMGGGGGNIIVVLLGLLFGRKNFLSDLKKHYDFIFFDFYEAFKYI